MSVRIDESGQNYAGPKIKFLGAARIPKPFDLPSGTNCSDAIVTDKQRTIANNSKVAERTPSPRHRPLERHKLGASGDKQVRQV